MFIFNIKYAKNTYIATVVWCSGKLFLFNEKKNVNVINIKKSKKIHNMNININIINQVTFLYPNLRVFHIKNHTKFIACMETGSGCPVLNMWLLKNEQSNNLFYYFFGCSIICLYLSVYVMDQYQTNYFSIFSFRIVGL